MKMTTENTETRRGERPGLLEESLTEQILGAAIEVHRYWGPGLYEQIYERSLCRELTLRGLHYLKQVSLPLLYKDERVGDDLQLDLLVENKAVVELKAVNALLPIHESQILTYLRLTGCRVGLLINFNECFLRQGIRRFVL